MFMQLLSVGIAAAITENMVFSRALGADYGIKRTHSFFEQMKMGLLVTLFTAIASMCGWVGRFFAENFFTLLSWTRPALLIAIYAAVMVLVMLGFYEYTARYTPRARQISAKLVYGFIPLGTLFVVGASTLTFPEAVVYGTGAGLGYILAITLDYCLQKRLAHSNVPIPFRGMPVTLLSFGMISLAIFGLLGHQLAV